MKLNKIEFIAMNNPIRAAIQEHYELPMLRSMITVDNIYKALEIGCGNGHGTKLIKKYFNPQNIVGIDLDERMIRLAKRKNDDQSITFLVMDAANLNFPDKNFDVIFDFGMIHHIRNWKDCLKELRRVLKDDGKIILEDLSSDTFKTHLGRIMKLLSDHPYADMYSTAEFLNYMKNIGFEIINYKASNPIGLIKFFSLTAKII
ncbi:MAG TPA: class I SAM-dependent methyltransferase [Syntrophales bacterium]|nr:class I SAM-dependent methyltransferase [Syntrophales bacterium]